MTIQKKILSIVMIIMVTFVSITGFYYNTYAIAATGLDYYQTLDIFSQLVGANEDVPINMLDEIVFDQLCPRDSGFIVRTIGRENYKLTKKAIAKILNAKYSNMDKNEDNITQSDINEVSQDLIQNISFNDESKTTVYNNNSREIVNTFINTYIEESGFRYVYTYNVVNYATQFSSGDQYIAYRDYIKNIQNEGKILCFNISFGNILVDMNNAAFVINSLGVNEASVTPYNLSSWERVVGDNYNYVDGEFVASGSQNGNIIGDIKLNQYSTNNMPYWGFYSSGQNNVYKAYMSLADLKADSVGQAPYYWNNQVYNDWSSSTGDYVVTTDNSNHATYGDITNYINSFNTENGEDPTDTDIHDWIINFDPFSGGGSGGEGGEGGQGGQGGSSNATATANNEGINVNVYNNHTINIGGGGSVSGNGTVSGNEIQDGGGLGNIFSFLSQIGDVLGSLIKNVGHVLAELVSGISETISALLEGIPTVFGDFMGALLGWLPEELRALITLGISAMIIVGVIKLFRG